MTHRTLRRACAASLLVLIACSARSAPPTAMLRDPEGRPVVIDQLPVRRIVSTNAAANEWIVLLGAADRLVARTDFDREPELAALPSIGGGMNPSAEAIVDLKPDAIIGWSDRSSVDLEHALAPFKIPVLSFETTDTADVFRNLGLLGQLLGRHAQADSLAASLREELTAIHQEACNGVIGPHPSVFLVLWNTPPMTAGGPTWMTTVLETACLRNAFEDLTLPWPQVSMEAITARDPDWILTSRGRAPGDRIAEFLSLPGWRDLAAVKAGRIIEIPGDLFARPGPSIAEAARTIMTERRRLDGK